MKMSTSSSASEALSPLLEEMLEPKVGNPEPARAPDMRDVPNEFLTDAGKAVKGWQNAQNVPPQVEAQEHQSQEPEAAPPSAEEVGPALAAPEPPPDFDAEQAMLALFGDCKPTLVRAGFEMHELQQLEAEDPTLDIVVSAMVAAEPNTYEFTPAALANLN